MSEQVPGDPRHDLRIAIAVPVHPTNDVGLSCVVGDIILLEYKHEFTQKSMHLRVGRHGKEEWIRIGISLIMEGCIGTYDVHTR